MGGATEQVRGAGSERVRGIMTRPAPWHRWAVLVALMPAAFTFDTVENLPIGLLELVSGSLRVSLSAVGLLVTGYGVTVAVASLPLAHVVRAVPRRHVLTGLLTALVVSSAVAALAPSYRLLLAARLLTAPAQAPFDRRPRCRPGRAATDTPPRQTPDHKRPSAPPAPAPSSPVTSPDAARLGARPADPTGGSDRRTRPACSTRFGPASRCSTGWRGALGAI